MACPRPQADADADADADAIGCLKTAGAVKNQKLSTIDGRVGFEPTDLNYSYIAQPMTPYGKAIFFALLSTAGFAIQDTVVKLLTQVGSIWQLMLLRSLAVSYTHLTLPTNREV